MMLDRIQYDDNNPHPHWEEGWYSSAFKYEPMTDFTDFECLEEITVRDKVEFDMPDGDLARDGAQPGGVSQLVAQRRRGEALDVREHARKDLHEERVLPAAQEQEAEGRKHGRALRVDGRRAATLDLALHEDVAGRRLDLRSGAVVVRMRDEALCNVRTRRRCRRGRGARDQRPGWSDQRPERSS